MLCIFKKQDHNRDDTYTVKLSVPNCHTRKLILITLMHDTSTFKPAAPYGNYFAKQTKQTSSRAVEFFLSMFAKRITYLVFNLIQ